MKKYKIIIIAVFCCIGLMGFGTAVNIGIKDMFNSSGKVVVIPWSTGQKDTRASLLAAAGGGDGDASYPIDLSGTQTTGVNTIAKGGTGGTDTASARLNIYCTSTVPTTGAVNLSGGDAGVF